MNLKSVRRFHFNFELNGKKLQELQMMFEKKFLITKSYLTDNGSVYKATDKKSKKDFTLFLINYECMDRDSKDAFIKKIKSRIINGQPNLLEFQQFYECPIERKIYILCEYCPYGDLNNLINRCKSDEKYLDETALYRIILQYLCAIKTLKCKHHQLNLNEIFLDKDFNVKLLNFNLASNRNKLKTFDLGRIVYNLTTLQLYDRKYWKSELEKLAKIYTIEYLTLLRQMLKDTKKITKNMHKILLNPTVLLRSSQWKLEQCFIHSKSRMQDVKSKESALELKEKLLKEKEYLLSKREKKLMVMERKTAICNETLNSECSATCGDESVLKTSSKLENYPKFSGRPQKRCPLKEIQAQNQLETVTEAEIDVQAVARRNSLRKRYTIAWSAESKKYAYDMLRIMNSNRQKVQHTFL